MRILWREVLKSINNDIQLVNSVLVEKVIYIYIYIYNFFFYTFIYKIFDLIFYFF